MIDKELIKLIEPGVLTTIYGPGGSGKTLLCMLLCKNFLENSEDHIDSDNTDNPNNSNNLSKNQNDKIIYLDSEGGFSTDRFLQISNEEVLDKILFIKPKNFTEQKKAVNEILQLINSKKNIKLVIVDTIAMQYRVEIANKENENSYKNLNKELIRQISLLVEIARTKNIPVILTNQVYSDLETGKINMVGGEMLKYSSKCILELIDISNELDPNSSGLRLLKVQKHRSTANKHFIFRIIGKGIEILQK